MPPNHYEIELGNLAKTYDQALSADVLALRSEIAGVSESSIIGVGSGGSFTVASLLCNLHETYTGRVSRPSTPLEIVCNPTLASSSPVFLISAEGKNPDVIEALVRARQNSARTVHVITNRRQSPLVQKVNELTDVSAHVFELKEKDGYLATNSLIMDAVLVARTYDDLDGGNHNLPSSIDQLTLSGQSVDHWLAAAEEFVANSAKCGSVIIVYSPLLRSIAADLESKLSEAALLHCQLADLRSFAHGRHLWLSARPMDCTVLALVEPSLLTLWEKTTALLPENVTKFTMPLAGGSPRDLLAGLVAQMRLVALLARRLGKDPGRPDVPSFGRELYYLDLTSLIPTAQQAHDDGEQSKQRVIGAGWPWTGNRNSIGRAAAKFRDSLEQQTFSAIVFDYDGTLCRSQRNDSPPPQPILQELTRLVAADVVVGIASGRGGSIQEHLKKELPEETWSKIRLGLYNGGLIMGMHDQIPVAPETSEFISHAARIVYRLKALGVPIEKIRTTHPHQISVRFREGVSTESMWFVVGDSLRQAGLDPTRMVRSKHSIDILGPSANKSHLVAHIIQSTNVEPYHILTIGDLGAWPGNDTELLEHRFSLSVDAPSRRLDRGWKLAPPHKSDVDATLWYLERVKTIGDGRFRITFGSAVPRAQ